MLEAVCTQLRFHPRTCPWTWHVLSRLPKRSTQADTYWTLLNHKHQGHHVPLLGCSTLRNKPHYVTLWTALTEAWTWSHTKFSFTEKSSPLSSFSIKFWSAVDTYSPILPLIPYDVSWTSWTRISVHVEFCLRYWTFIDWCTYGKGTSF